MRLFFFSVYIFVGTPGDRACPYFLFPDRSLWVQEEIVLAFLFIILDQSLFYDALVRWLPVGTRECCVFPSSTLRMG